jgi:hypothetical protein
MSPSGQDRSAQTGVARRQGRRHRFARPQPRQSARCSGAATVSICSRFTSVGSACITPLPSPVRGRPPVRRAVPTGATAGNEVTHDRLAELDRPGHRAKTWRAPGRARLLPPPQSEVGRPARTPVCGGRAWHQRLRWSIAPCWHLQLSRGAELSTWWQAGWNKRAAGNKRAPAGLKASARNWSPAPAMASRRPLYPLMWPGLPSRGQRAADFATPDAVELRMQLPLVASCNE